MPFKMKNSSTQNEEWSLRRWIASFQGINKKRNKYLKRNGELLLRQRVAVLLGLRENVPPFTEQELITATHNFDREMLDEVGSYYDTYKGNLPDGRIVSIKAYKSGNIARAINEIVVLSQLNHKNVVKLIGCCLETNVPLLVYEFFSGKSLYELLFGPGHGSLSWLTRLHIVTEVARTLVYLHSRQKQSSYRYSFPSLPTVHAGLAPKYILIDDENHNIRLSGFEVSKMVQDDELQDCFFGAPGYIDPQFMMTGKLIDKSDVYSFGILLTVMLTGLKASSFLVGLKTRLGEFFLQAAKEGRLFEMLEPRIKSEAKMEHIQSIIEIIDKCLKNNGEERPAMKEIAVELQRLRTNLTPAQ